MFPSHWELLVIFLVVLLLFGAKRIPEMAKGLGKGIREFRSAVKDVQEEVDVAGRSGSSSQRASAIPPASPPEGQVPRGDATQTAPASDAQKDGEGASTAREEAR